MAFISSKLRKVILSGVIAAGMGVAPTSGVFKELGSLARSMVDVAVMSAKFGSGLALFGKTTSTVGLKAGILKEDNLTDVKDAVVGFAKNIDLEKPAEGVTNLVLYSNEEDNAMQLAGEGAVFFGSFGVGKVLDGFSKTKVEKQVIVKEVPVPVYDCYR